jgi:hypothetical protein
LRQLKVNAGYPFLLAMYHDYREAIFARRFLSAIRLIERMLFRRAVCAIYQSWLNKTFRHVFL